jgi:hypothetical protein
VRVFLVSAADVECEGNDLMLNRVGAAVVALVAGVGLFSPAATTSAMAHPTGTIYGCPDGAACMYHEGSGPTPFLKLYSYGPHNLSNVFGNKFMFNNQYGSPGPLVWLCSGYNGTGEVLYDVLEQHTWSDGDGNLFNATPVNSVVLGRPGEPAHCN